MTLDAGAGVNLAVGFHDRARVSYRIAAELAVVAKDSTEFSDAGIDNVLTNSGFYIAAVIFQVRQLGAGAKIDVGAENRIADIIEVRRLGAIQRLA